MIGKGRKVEEEEKKENTEVRDIYMRKHGKKENKGRV